MLTRGEYRFVTFPDSWDITGSIYPVRNDVPSIRGEDWAFLWEAYITRRRLFLWQNENSVPDVSLSHFVPKYYDSSSDGDLYDLWWSVDEIAPRESELSSLNYMWLRHSAMPNGFHQDQGTLNFDVIARDAMAAAYGRSHYVGEHNNIPSVLTIGKAAIDGLYDVIRNTNRYVTFNLGASVSVSGWTTEESGSNPTSRFPGVYGNDVLVGSGSYLYDRPDMSGEEVSASCSRIAGGVAISVSVPSVVGRVNYVGICLYCGASARTSMSGVNLVRVVWLPALFRNGAWGVDGDQILAEARAFYDSVEAVPYQENMYSSHVVKYVTVSSSFLVDVSIEHTGMQDFETI
jgi:hypothetical protein